MYRKIPSKRKNEPLETFTYRDAKKVYKKEFKPKTSAGLQKRKSTEYSSGGIRRTLTRLGVNQSEIDEYLMRCDDCKIVNQDLNKGSLKTLFGDEVDAVGHHTDDSYGLHGHMSVGSNERQLFLKPLETVSRKQTTAFGPKYVYFITIVVGTTPLKNNKTTKPNKISLSLPPREKDDQTKADLIADLMIDKIFFVVRYIYKTFEKELGSKGLGTSRRLAKNFRSPVVIIKPDPGTEISRPFWYKKMREKILQGQENHAKSLSLQYRCSIL